MKKPKFDYKNKPSEEILKRAKEIKKEQGWKRPSTTELLTLTAKAHLEYEDWKWERERR